MSGWLWFLVCLGFSIAAHHRSFRFEVNNFYIRPTVRDIFESINWTQPNRSTLSIAWILKRQIDQMDLETSLDIIKSDKQKMRLYHIRLDACKFLTTIHKNRIFTLLAKSVNRGSNEHLKCPLKPVSIHSTCLHVCIFMYILHIIYNNGPLLEFQLYY